jgi:hypothetical protein
MISHCANPKCAKPLHYLREGRIFAFRFPDINLERRATKSASRVGHYWLCGDCVSSFTLRQNLVYGVDLCEVHSGESHVTATETLVKVAS